MAKVATPGESVARRAHAGRSSAWRRISDEDDTTPAEFRPALSLSNPDFSLQDLARGVPELEYRDWGGLRTIAIAIASLGAVLVILGLGEGAGWGAAAAVPWGAACLMLGGSGGLLLAILPGRSVATPLENQAAEWDAAKQQYQRVHTWAKRCAMGAVVVVVALGAAIYFLPSWAILQIGLGAVTLTFSILWGILASRRQPLRLALRQTMLLRELEQRGLAPAGALDPRVQSVMLALDQLLGDLPDSAVQRFLASEESGTFLGLLAEVRRN